MEKKIEQNAQDLLNLIHNTALTTSQRESLLKGLETIYKLASDYLKLEAAKEEEKTKV